LPPVFKAYLRAARVRPGLDLVEFARSFPDARGLLLDAFVEGYGGGGHVFDWTLIPPCLPSFLVLSGGLTADNVGDAIERVRPVAVDVSSGVEMSKGIKDHSKIAAFVAAVRKADEQYNFPDAKGHFGPYGGVFVAETLFGALDELKAAYAACQADPAFVPSTNTS
jgi:hypothetical protein